MSTTIILATIAFGLYLYSIYNKLKRSKQQVVDAYQNIQRLLGKQWQITLEVLELSASMQAEKIANVLILRNQGIAIGSAGMFSIEEILQTHIKIEQILQTYINEQLISAEDADNDRSQMLLRQMQTNRQALEVAELVYVKEANHYNNYQSQGLPSTVATYFEHRQVPLITVTLNKSVTAG